MPPRRQTTRFKSLSRPDPAPRLSPRRHEESWKSRRPQLNSPSSSPYRAPAEGHLGVTRVLSPGACRVTVRTRRCDLTPALRCYTCVFPAISPIDCLKFPQECPAGQRCLSSVAIGTQGTLRLVLYEKSCAFASQCGLSGDKSAAGLNFTYTNECCDAD
ncbi:hypothetical protein Z043_118871, partial [Scleropages formosus]